MSNLQFEWQSVRQFNSPHLFAAFAIPSVIAFVGFHFILPAIYASGVPAIVAWPTIASTMLLGFAFAAVLLMKREADALGVSLKARMCLKPLSWRQWGFAIGVLLIGVVAAAGLGSASQFWSNITGLHAPAYFPFFLDPSIDPMSTSSSEVTPGFELKGAYWLIGLMLITLGLNILVEELYFRAWLLPKMQFLGGASWVVNGFGFAFYHTFQLWLLPQILPLSLFMAFVVYKTRSIWPAFAIHLVVNSLTVAAMILLIVT
jgi:membrane protease YdiL (CAAX protease family)